MNKQQEALKLALEALEYLRKPIAQGWEAETQQEKRDQAITAIREALAEQPAQQESEAIHAAWMAGYTEGEREAIEKQTAQQQEPKPPYDFERYVAGSLRAQGVRVERATTLADAMRIAARICPQANPPSAPTVLVYTSSPASNPWVGLSTNDLDEIDAPIREKGHATIAEIYRDIETKLREKNA